MKALDGKKGLASAGRLPVVVRIPASPLGSLKCDPLPARCCFFPAFGPVWRPGWALAPFSAVFSFCCLLCFSAGETQVWLGDLRVVVFCWFLWLCVLIDLRAPMNICPCTNLFSAYIHVRTDTRGKKKVQCGALVQFVRWSLPLGIWLHL